MSNETYIEAAERIGTAINELYTRVTISLQPLIRIQHPYTKETRRINEQWQRRQYTRAGRRRKEQHRAMAI